MRRIKLVVICVIISLIVLSLNFTLYDVIMPKESFADSKNESDKKAMQWSKAYGGIGIEEAYALIQTPDSGYVIAGHTRPPSDLRSDMLLVKTDVVGVAQWNQTYGGKWSEHAHALLQTSDDGFAVAGYTDSFGAGDWDMWLLKTDRNGVIEWNKTYGGTGRDSASSLLQTKEGGFALAGYTHDNLWLVKTDANGIAEWNRTYGECSSAREKGLIQTADRGFALASNTRSFGAGDWDMWLLKTDADGVVQWNKTYGGTEGEHAFTAIQTTDGGFLIAGETFSFGPGISNLWLVKTDTKGTPQWNKTYGSGEPYALLQTENGDFAFAGHTDSFGAGNMDMWLVKTDVNGTVQWERTYGGKEADLAYALIQTTDGGFALAGYTDSFGAGGWDMWLVKTDAEGDTGTVTAGKKTSGLEILPLLTTFVALTIWYKRKTRLPP